MIEDEQYNNTSSLGLYRLGYGYLKAANLILSGKNMTENIDIFFPGFFLISHAIELGLKGFIFEKAGKNRRGHNFRKLYIEALTHGFHYANQEQLSPVITWLEETIMNQHYLRYHCIGRIVVLPSYPVSEVANDFFEQLALQIPGAEKIRNGINEKYPDARGIEEAA